MDRPTTQDAADRLNAQAARLGWPLRASSSLQFDRPELNRLRDVWYEKAAGRPLPYRRDFDLRALKPNLTNLVILHREEDSGRYLIRLVGSQIVQQMGRDATGSYLDEVTPAEVLPRWLAVYDAAMQAGAPLRCRAHYEHQHIDHLVSESLQAPMLDDDGQPTKLLSCAYFQLRADAPIS